MRSSAHDAFVDSCNALLRSMAAAGEVNEWRHLIGNSRKRVSDFAYRLHCHLPPMVSCRPEYGILVDI